MSVVANERSAIDEAGRLLVESEIGKKLGLEPDDLRVGLDVAKSLLDRGSPERAMRIYAAMVLCEPMVADFQIGLANCALNLGENHVALQAASAVIVLEPSNPRGYFLSGRACLALSQYAEAAEDLQDAIRCAKAANDRLVLIEAERLLRSLDGFKS